GDLRVAKDLAQRAVELAPKSLPARILLGRIFIAAGMKANAKRELEEAAKLDPKDEIVKNLLRELK
ncbi:MAG TPA: tetratricopeptide repeat protein, partial [Polyangiaceae bacterium LLY-WYZ-15_(1-7)]|nr:tetratricopeptide repeat protein [Polyangiaceae bacterium LLY-WYZ-15_(1-7)]